MATKKATKKSPAKRTAAKPVAKAKPRAKKLVPANQPGGLEQAAIDALNAAKGMISDVLKSCGYTKHAVTVTLDASGKGLPKLKFEA